MNIRSINPFVLLLAAVYYVPSWGLRGLRWKLLAQSLGDSIPLMPATAAATAGNFLNLILPAKLGDLLWAHAAQRRWGMPYLRALVGVLSGRVLDLWVLLLLGLGAAWWWIQEFRSLVLLLLVLLGLSTLFSLLALRKNWLRALLRGPLSRFQGLHDLLAGSLARLFCHRMVITHVLITFAIWWIEAWVALKIGQGMGLSFTLSVVFLAIAVANLSKIFPLTPASMGTYEAAAAIILIQLGWGYEAIFAFALVEHVLKNVVNALLGVIALACFDLPMLEVDREQILAQWRRWKSKAVRQA